MALNANPDSAFTMFNGFCGRNCQDLFCASLLFSSDMGLSVGIPVTASQAPFENPPWDLPGFFHRQLLPAENSRSWIFGHSNIPPNFGRMASNFSWSPEDYKSVTLNNRAIYVRHLRLKYHRDRHNHGGQVCLCNHGDNMQMCHGWKMFQYKFRGRIFFCLSFKTEDQESPRPARLVSDRKRFEDEGERRDDDRLINPPKKRFLAPAPFTKPVAIKDMRSEMNNGCSSVIHGWIEWDQLDALYESNCDFKVLEASLNEGGQLYGKEVYAFGFTESQVMPNKADNNSALHPAVNNSN